MERERRPPRPVVHEAVVVVLMRSASLGTRFADIGLRIPGRQIVLPDIGRLERVCGGPTFEEVGQGGGGALYAPEDLSVICPIHHKAAIDLLDLPTLTRGAEMMGQRPLCACAR